MMDEEIDESLVLDYAVLRTLPAHNSYEAHVCSQGIIEKLDSGPLDQLALHLEDVSLSRDNSFKLELVEGLKGSSWFTKLTLARFLNIVNKPEALKVASAILNEMSQLEETRRFQLMLYTKGHTDHSGGGTSDCSKEVGLGRKVKVETASSDATKNELLRAMDLRLAALKEDIGAAFNRAAGAMCSVRQLSDLVLFAQHFGATDLRNSLSKYLTVLSHDQADLSVDQLTVSHDPRKNTDIIRGDSHQVSLRAAVEPITSGTSPAKIAQAERESSTGSEDSSESSDEDRSVAERSRPVIRSASPRRSASPMRRVQIGRSGSRRSTALTIKSLNYFPSRDRVLSNRDADGTNSGNEESIQPPNRPENTVRRMSVQDAINLFERKQKDQNVDVQKQKVSVDVPVNTNKSVLRRWSSGMGDSFIHCSHENSSDAGSENTSRNLPSQTEENKLTEFKPESNPASGSVIVNTELTVSSEIERKASPEMDSPAESLIPKAEEIHDRTTASAEWSRQKEAELNQMLVKMMDSNPGKCRGINSGGGVHQDISSEQRGGFYSQYKEKRDEKLRNENDRMRAMKKAQFKVMQDNLEQSKAVMASKTGGLSVKQDLLNQTQRPRRNSLPPVLAKKEVLRQPGSRKTSTKQSSLPSTRSSWSSGSLSRVAATPPAKLSPGTISNNSTPNRKKQHMPPSPTKPIPRAERPMQQPKIRKTTVPDNKPIFKGQQEEQKKSVAQTSRDVKTKSPSVHGDDPGAKSAKPSFYNKVTKKGSVVPLESKPFLRKGNRTGPGVGTVPAKTKVSHSDDSPKNSGNIVQAEELESTSAIAESNTVVEERHLTQSKTDVDVKFEAPLPVSNNLDQEKVEKSDHVLAAADVAYRNSEVCGAEIQPDQDISSAAWVEVEHHDVHASCDNGLPVTANIPGVTPVASSSPRIRHSLSQMLQADSSEPDIIEWGNAENPPSLIYQKDAPRGFKRLLKFTRKNKGDTDTTGWGSPSVFSEGEDDPEEFKAASKRSSDSLLRKAGNQSKVYGQQKNMLSESFDGDSKEVDYQGIHDSLPVKSSMNNTTSSDKLRERHNPSAATSTKATRSFFSLSAFRSGKSSDTKRR